MTKKKQWLSALALVTLIPTVGCGNNPSNAGGYAGQGIQRGSADRRPAQGVSPDVAAARAENTGDDVALAPGRAAVGAASAGGAGAIGTQMVGPTAHVFEVNPAEKTVSVQVTDLWHNNQGTGAYAGNSGAPGHQAAGNDNTGNNYRHYGNTGGNWTGRNGADVNKYATGYHTQITIPVGWSVQILPKQALGHGVSILPMSDGRLSQHGMINAVGPIATSSAGSRPAPMGNVGRDMPTSARDGMNWLSGNMLHTITVGQYAIVNVTGAQRTILGTIAVSKSVQSPSVSTYSHENGLRR